MRRWIARHDTAAFLLLTFGVSWPLWLVSGALRRTPVMAPSFPWFVAQLGVFAPALAGLLVGAFLEPEGRRRALRTLTGVYLPAAALALWTATRGFASFAEIDARAAWATSVLGVWVLVWFASARNRSSPWVGPPARGSTVAAWSLGCAVAPTALFLIAWSMTGGGSAGVGGGAASLPSMPTRDPTTFGLLSAFAVNLSFGGTLGEEPGWRGAWLPRLLRRHTAFGATAIVSFWWALWHAPIDLAQGFALPGAGGLVMRQIWTFPLTVLFTWVTIRAGGSLMPPMILHTTLNSFSDFGAGDPGRHERAVGLFFVLALVLAVVVLAADSRVWRERGRRPEE